MIRKILLYTVGAVVLLAVLATVVGYALPQSHVASGEAHLEAAPAAVFARLAQVERYPEWRAGVQAVEILSREPMRWRERTGGDVITYAVVESVAPHRRVVRIDDPELPFGGAWTYELQPEGSGTRLRITEHGEVYNPIFRFMSRFVFGHTATIDEFLRHLADAR